MGVNKRRFENRFLRITNDGEDFEQFVFESFRYAADERGVAKRLARGRDGAIDLRDALVEPGYLTIGECKYIGSGRAADALSRWAEVFRHLRDHLPDLAQNPALKPRSPYRGWLDEVHPVSKYRFCVSVAMTETEQNELTAKIRADFTTLVEMGVEQLRKLISDNEAISVRTWDWFSAELDEHPSLAFRWFRGLPVGMSLFESEVGASSTFRRFISGKGLRYFSRDEYAASEGRVLDRPESRLLREIAEGESAVLLITGAGGVGKTRLCFELASALVGERYGYDAYWLERSTNFDSIINLASKYAHDANILLLLDYAEAATSLNQIADAVAHLAVNSEHRIRLIVTCRSSATNRVRDSLNELESDWKNLDSRVSGEEGFTQWVTDSILSLMNYQNVGALGRVCHGIPALAAFALYLFRQEPTLFDKQFGRLRVDDNFHQWVNRRIASLARRLGTSGSVDRILAEIAVGLPCSAEDWVSSIQPHALLNDALLADRWVEREGGYYTAAHDVFADALILRWVFEAERVATERLTDLLVLTARNGHLEQGLIVTARLASDPRFNQIDGEAVVSGLFERCLGPAGNCIGAILAGPLLTTESKLRLLKHLSEVSELDWINSEVHPALSLIALNISKSDRSQLQPDLLRVFGELLEEACEQPQGSNMLLRRAYAFDPARFRTRTYQNVTRFPIAAPTHFLIVQMLRSGEPVDEMAEHVQNWLQGNATNLKSSFVVAAWLRASGNVELVRGAVSDWLNVHSQFPAASHVYGSWLAAGGEFESISQPLLDWIRHNRSAVIATHGFAAWLRGAGHSEFISEHMLEWLTQNIRSVEALFACRIWIDAGASPDIIGRFVAQALAEHGDRAEARPLYQSWLYLGHDQELIKDPFKSWLISHAEDFEARNLLKIWLDRKGDQSIIVDGLGRWIEKHATALEAAPVFAAWLAAGGNLSTIDGEVRTWLDLHGVLLEAGQLLAALLSLHDDSVSFSYFIDAWLAAHGQEEEAQLVYSAWLATGEAGGSTEMALARWIDRHAEAERASQVYCSWLQARGSIKPISRQLLRWVTSWSSHESFAFLSKALTKSADLTENDMIIIARWASLFPQHEDSLFRTSAILLRASNGNVSTTAVTMIINYALDVLSNRDFCVGTDEGQLWSIAGIIGKPSVYNKNPFGSLRLFSDIFLTGKVFIRKNANRPFEQLVFTYDKIVQLLKYSLRNGFIDPTVNRAEILQFADWLMASCIDAMESRRLLHSIKLELSEP